MKPFKSGFEDFAKLKKEFCKVLKSLIVKQILMVLLGAMLIRSLFFINVHGKPALILQPDSRMYVSLSDGIMRFGKFVYPDRPDVPETERMPGYPVFIASIRYLLPGGLLSVSAVQILIGSITCVLIYILGEMVLKGAGFLSGILAVINTGLITYSIFILNDGLFLFFFLLIIILVLKFFKKPTYVLSILIGLLSGLCSYIRPVVIYFPAFVSLIMLFYLITSSHIKKIEAYLKSITIVAVFLITICPWMIRNYMNYGKFSLQSQAGEHMLQYIVPFVWQYSKGIPFIEGMKRANEIFDEKIKSQGIANDKSDPFEISDLRVKTALEILKNEPKTAIIKAWVYGMIKNLFAPSIIDLSYLLDIKRPHFFYTKGKTLIERAWNFISSMKGVFSWALVGSILVLLISRFIQLLGLFHIFKFKVWEGIFFLITIGYFLLISGPVGYAKYRLPIEPILIILTVIGIRSLFFNIYQKRK